MIKFYKIAIIIYYILNIWYINKNIIVYIQKFFKDLNLLKTKINLLNTIY